MSALVLTLNAGSSSLKFGLYAAASEPEEIVTGLVERIGEAAALRMAGGAAERLAAADVGDHAGALRAALAALEGPMAGRAVAAVGHRVVHGGPDLDAPAAVDDALFAKLEALSSLAPLHQPHNLAGVRAARAAFPDAVQVACFDTAFHRGHPWVNDAFALPRRFYDQGVRRYGFHGLSYDYVAGRLAEIDSALAAGRVVIAHLGNGASICGLLGGRSEASTMGFTALDGLPMGTRCGQLDPGVVLHLIEHEGMSAAQVTALLYKESGLLGLSGVSNDMRALLASDAPEAAQAVDYYVFRLRREVGAMAAALGGLDALVFCGGVGENAAPIRARVCDGMAWLGIALDPAANAAGAQTLSARDSAVRVLVVPTDEERVIARAAAAAI